MCFYSVCAVIGQFWGELCYATKLPAALYGGDSVRVFVQLVHVSQGLIEAW